MLVVDDLRQNRDLLLAICREGGYRAQAVARAVEALDAARLDPPDLIVSDVLMPEVDGFELVRTLREDPRLAATKVLFWTGHYDDREVRELAETLGVARVLPKACGAVAMLRAVEEALTADEPAAGPLLPPEEFGADHARVLNDKLVEKVEELELARDALREREDELRVLVSNIPGAVYRRRLDPDLTVEFVSDRIEEISGYAAASLIEGAGRSYAGIVHPEDRERVVSEVRAAVEAGDHYGLAYRIVRPDGEEVWVGDRGQAVRNDDDDELLSYGTITDISERKRLEADRDRMEIELRVAQKLEAVGQLAAGIAHEINTPVQFVGDSVLFLRECYDDLDRLLAAYREAFAALPGDAAVEATRHGLEQLEQDVDLVDLQGRVPAAFARTAEGVERVASLVRALKEFAHTQSEQAPADLNRAIATTLTVARNEYKYVAEVEVDFGDLPPVVCSLGDLNQVFLNLVVNAAHAIEDTPRGLDEKGVIAIRTRREDETVVITIADSGCGIPETIRTRIFDPFFTTKQVGRGSGQGLAIARAVVERHGGALEFESEPGVGTTFTIRIPIAGTAVEGRFAA